MFIEDVDIWDNGQARKSVFADQVERIELFGRGGNDVIQVGTNEAPVWKAPEIMPGTLVIESEP